MSENKRWIITLSETRPWIEVQKNLIDAGFKIDQVLGEIGVIIGVADAGAVSGLSEIDGVADVSPEAPIDIGPPDSSITW